MNRETGRHEFVLPEKSDQIFLLTPAAVDFQKPQVALPIGTNQTCSGPDESNEVSLVDQDVSGDYEIESLLGPKGFNRRLFSGRMDRNAPRALGSVP